MSGSWNDGPGDAPTRRARSAFMRMVEVDGDGHWVWRGELNFAGGPSFQMPSGGKQSAHLVAYDLFRGKRVSTLQKVCGHRMCVRPDMHHWRRARAAK